MTKEDLIRYREVCRKRVYNDEEFSPEDFEKDIYYPIIGDFNNNKHLKLYRYSSLNDNNIDAFDRDIIYLANNDSLNDLFEGIPSEVSNQTSVDRHLEYYKELFYSKSFSEVYDNPIMWGLYADSHTGFCVGYDLSLLEKENEALRHIYPVVYDEKRAEDYTLRQDYSDITGKAKEKLEKDILLPLMLLKDRKWENELEWRVAKAFSPNEKVEKELPFDCVTEVYLGARTPKFKRKIIENLVREKSNRCNREIKLFIMKPNLYKFELESEKYECN